jgi:hypothetical protein|eukprot:COSAG06_NODE_7533_length_2468_cov_3.608696_1_plen_558_part_00
MERRGAARQHRLVARAVVRSGASKQVLRRKRGQAWQESDIDGDASKLCRSIDDLATVAEWSSSRPLPAEQTYFDAVETADLRASKDDLSSLQAEHDYLAAVRVAKQARCESLQQALREVALARVEPAAVGEQKYLQSQMVAIDEARKAEAKYQQVLTGMVDRSELAYRQAEEELEALQRVTRKCDRELSKAKRYRTAMAQEQESCYHELRRMRATMQKVGKTRRAQLLQLTKLHGTERELIRRAVARELRKQEISQAVAGDLTSEDEQALQEYSAVMDLDASNRQTSLQRGMNKHMADMEQAMQLLCEASGATGAEEIIDRFHTQRQMHEELTARKLKLTGRLVECKETKTTLSGQQYVIDVTSGPSVLLKKIEGVQETVEARQKDLDKRRTKCAKVAFSVLEATDTMWRSLKRLERSILAVEVTAAEFGGGGGGAAGSTDAASHERTVYAHAAMLSAEAAADEENLRAANTTGKWEPLQLLDSYSSRLFSMFRFFSNSVPQELIHARPEEESVESEHAEEVRKLASQNNLRVRGPPGDFFQEPRSNALEESTNINA